MSTGQTLARMRQFLLVIAAAVFVMTVTELVFLSHWSETIQLLPFALSGWGLLTLALAYFHPTSGTINLLRWSMIVIGLCSLIGIYEHMANNLGFQMEIQPNATFGELALATVEGANPVLAPGILALGAAIGWTGAYQYSALEEKHKEHRAVETSVKQKA